MFFVETSQHDMIRLRYMLIFWATLLSFFTLKYFGKILWVNIIYNLTIFSIKVLHYRL